jgi:hypothetical protein
MSLRIMRDKGIITQAEFDSAMHDLQESIGSQAASAEGNAVLGKWSTSVYGFIDADMIYDSTRSFNDLAGASQIQQEGVPGSTAAGANPRWQSSIRNSRFGARLRAPEFNGVRASALFEWDFLGAQLPIATGPYTAPANNNPAPATTISPSPYGSESTFFTSPTMRIRHAYVKIETPIVDFLGGQYWSLFGWGPTYQPGTVEYQGVPGEVYSRNPQFRISKSIKAYPITLDLAVAAFRPVQRDGGLPDGQAGLKLSIDSWTGYQSSGQTGTQISPMSIAVSGLLRNVSVNDFNVATSNTNTKDLTLSALAVDAYLPIVPATKSSKDNALSAHGEFTTGYGDADMFTNMNGGVGFPKPTATASYTPDIDQGIVSFDGAGGLHGIQWTTYLFGLQYAVPGTAGKLVLTGNYGHMESANSHYYTFGSCGVTTNAATMVSTLQACSVRAAEDWFDANVFADPWPGVRFGVEYANFNDMSVNGIHAINHRGQLAAYFVF